MFKLSYFERLKETVTMMVRHPEYATKAQALVQCRHEVVDLKGAGRISAGEAEALLKILDTYPQTAGREVRDSRQSERARLQPA